MVSSPGRHWWSVSPGSERLQGLQGVTNQSGETARWEGHVIRGGASGRSSGERGWPGRSTPVLGACWKEGAGVATGQG